MTHQPLKNSCSLVSVGKNVGQQLLRVGRMLFYYLYIRGKGPGGSLSSLDLFYFPPVQQSKIQAEGRASTNLCNGLVMIFDVFDPRGQPTDTVVSYHYFLMWCLYLPVLSVRPFLLFKISKNKTKFK